jgi:fido (protein-threonine AMPylation protein)
MLFFNQTPSSACNRSDKNHLSRTNPKALEINHSVKFKRFHPVSVVLKPDLSYPERIKLEIKEKKSPILPPILYASDFKKPTVDPCSQWMIPEYSPNKTFRNYVDMKALYREYQWSNNNKDDSSCPFEIKFIREGLRYNLHQLWNRPLSENITKESLSLYQDLQEKSLYLCKENHTTKILEINPNKLNMIKEQIKYFSNTLDESRNLTNQSSKNWDRAVLMIDDWSLSSSKNYISPKDISHLHRILFKDISSMKNNDGQYRKMNAFSGKDYQGFYYLSHHDIPPEINYFCDWLNKNLYKTYGYQGFPEDNQNPIILASKAYERFISIHPFLDGNGRVGRSIVNFILQKFDLLPPCLDKKDPRSAGGVSGMIPYKIPHPDDIIHSMMNGLKKSYSLFE